eukprot:7553948-Pyramimonas_sp.AAC.1
MLQSVHNLDDMLFAGSEVPEYVRLGRRDAGNAGCGARECNLVRVAAAGHPCRIAAKGEIPTERGR